MERSQDLSRREFLTRAALAGAAVPLPLSAAAAGPSAPLQRDITVETIAEAERIAGVTFTPEQRAAMLESLERHLETLARLHAEEIPNSVIPPHLFDPTIAGDHPRPPVQHAPWEPPQANRPGDDESLAFQPVHVLASLLRSREVTSVELTTLYMERLKRYDPVLQCVITLTEERAMAQARAADAELDAGLWRGPLHGVPWGAKDLLAVRGYPTTWGAMPYRDQVIDVDAAVVRKLDAAGAVLVAKLTLGALAWADVWFGGTTRNPWNPEQGASGSSAGPGSAVAAGLVGFAIGSETLGSIVSPSRRNGVAGLRPTFGRVSRAGAMTLSWSMDKLGPMCRTAFDCGLVLDAINGADPADPFTQAADFRWPVGPPASQVRVGYIPEAFEDDYEDAETDRQTLDVLRGLGYDLQPMAWPDVNTRAMQLALSVESAAAFDWLSRTGGTDSMVRQDRWPESFRAARFITAIDYINGQRQRTGLMQAMSTLMQDFDVIVSNRRRGELGITNLTGHPSVTVPNALHRLEDQPDSPRRNPEGITFVGGLWKDSAALAVAHAYQQATDYHLQRPPIQ